jgi:hypothetical protein
MLTYVLNKHTTVLLCVYSDINFNNITDLTGGTINIINSLGQQVATTSITTTGSNSIMSLSNWGGTGLYFVQILNQQGQIVDIKKILLQ